MTFAEAMVMAQAGHDIRHPGMGRGWIAKKLLKDKDDLFYINPITGSNYRATFSDEDKARTDWKAGEGLAAL